MSAILDMVKNTFGDDPEITKAASEVVNACAGSTDGDRCIAVEKIMECTDKEVKAHGYTIN